MDKVVRTPSKNHFSTNYHYIVNETKYKARKVQSMIKLIELQAINDISKVNLKDYLMLLEKLAEYNKELTKDRTVRGVDKKRLDTQVLKEGSDADGKDESSGMGVGVSTADPFA